MVNCEQLAKDLEATTAELAEHQSRWRSEKQAHRDQLHALRATVRLGEARRGRVATSLTWLWLGLDRFVRAQVEQQDAMITTLQQPAAVGDDEGSGGFDVPVVSGNHSAWTL